MRDVAIPIDAATAKGMARLGITNAKGLNKISPALNVVRGGALNAVFLVCGVGNFAVNASIDSALVFTVEGVFIISPIIYLCRVSGH